MSELFKQTYHTQAIGEKNSQVNNLAYNPQQNLMKNHQAGFQYKLLHTKPVLQIRYRF